MDDKIYFKIINKNTISNQKEIQNNWIDGYDSDEDHQRTRYYFGTKDTIHEYYQYGDTLAVVELPTNDSDIRLDDDYSCQRDYHTNMFVIKEVYPLSDICIYEKFSIKYPDLDICAAYGYSHLVRFLVENGVDKNMHNKAFLASIFAGNMDIIKYLVDTGADINFIYCDKKPIVNRDDDIIMERYLKKYSHINALILSTLNGRTDLVQYLLRNGADPNLDFNDIYPESENALYLSLDSSNNNNQYEEIFKYLLENSNPPEKYFEELLKECADNGKLDMMKLLIAKSNCFDKIKNTLLIISTRRGYYNVVKFLIENGADIHIENDLLLVMSCRNGYLEIVKLLVDNGADIYVNNDSVIMDAVDNGRSDVVKYLMENGSDIDFYKNRALIECSVSNHYNMVKLLLENGADVHYGNESSLLNSVYHNRINIVKILVENGADIHANNDYALILSINRGNLHITEYLIKIGANVDVLNDEQKLQLEKLIN